MSLPKTCPLCRELTGGCNGACGGNFAPSPMIKPNTTAPRDLGFEAAIAAARSEGYRAGMMRVIQMGELIAGDERNDFDDRRAIRAFCAKIEDLIRAEAEKETK